MPECEGFELLVERVFALHKPLFVLFVVMDLYDY